MIVVRWLIEQNDEIVLRDITEGRGNVEKGDSGVEIVFVSPFEEICLNVFGLNDGLLLGSGSHGRNHSRLFLSSSPLIVLLQQTESANRVLLYYSKII